ncbi:methyltransferase [Mucilaginibacter sp. PPCGB 2223]|uniref:O-methyltransferase n=1 Tax=Mucilaginibacter sp. PPCGB 2223 TaxID=1886027 RepID=UPI000824450B|nr:O-methyltransferase [Mucilaginibacter sp. PPCGB 2223]OCX50543.1 methyltransferase [Mucilaginibacter sp. PPCGB 2223]
MEILPEILQQYLETHCEPEPELLKNINRETYLKVLKPHMLSGHYQGRLLSMLSKLMQPKCILEIGTYTGYATICLAEGLVEGGEIHTIEVNREMEEMIRKNFAASAFEKSIFPHFGDAQQIILELSGKVYDIAFVDADKKNNLTYFNMILPQVKSGGLIIVDNVLWKGKVYDSAANDTDTRLIREFNDAINVNDKVEKLILPVRDGILIIRKK